MGWIDIADSFEIHWGNYPDLRYVNENGGEQEVECSRYGDSYIECYYM